MSDNITPEQVDGQLTIDDADTAVGYRTVADPADGAELSADNPNVAAPEGGGDPATIVGDPVNDDSGVAAASRALDAATAG